MVSVKKNTDSHMGSNAPIITYTMDDFDRIKKNGFTYRLTQSILECIRTISSDVGAPEYIKTPMFEKRPSNKQKYKERENINEDFWDLKPAAFKATVLEQKQGIEVHIGNLRKHLNKMNEKTFDNLREQIVSEIDEIYNKSIEGELNTELSKICDTIFDIASGNSFYTKLYAKLFKYLIDKYTFIKDTLDARLDYSINNNLFEDFVYVDSDDNYDLFCKNNKKNDTRRALVSFYINLMYYDVITVDIMIAMLDKIQLDMIKNIGETGKQKCVEEMSEIVFIFITTGSKHMIKCSDEWDQIMNRVNIVAGMKAKSKPSISNKTIFKHMDILKCIESPNNN